MKAKTIRKVLRKKIDDWLLSIADEEVRRIAAKNVIVTGGSIASMLLGEKVNDYDVYFKTVDAAKAVACYYVQEYNKKKDPSIRPIVMKRNGRVRIVVQSSGIIGEAGGKNYQYYETLPDENTESEQFIDDNLCEPSADNEEIQELINDDEKYRPVFMSANAITLSQKIQLILRFTGTPEEIHENYDFTHCTNWWSSWDDHLELRKEALECLLSRELKYQGSKYPLCSIIRTRKFIKRDWQINAGQYLKMCMQLNDLDLNDPDVLEDQLTGVDVAYFFQVINYIKESGKDITTTYICEIIDRIF